MFLWGRRLQCLGEKGCRGFEGRRLGGGVGEGWEAWMEGLGPGLGEGPKGPGRGEGLGVGRGGLGSGAAVGGGVQGVTEGGPGVATTAGESAVSAKRPWGTRGGWGGVGWRGVGCSGWDEYGGWGGRLGYLNN